MNRMMVMIEAIACPPLVVNPPINDLPVREEGWYNDPEMPRIEVPRAERERVKRLTKIG